MKTLFTFLTVLFVGTLFSQDKFIVHKATPINSFDNFTYIDHPDLNNNPNACLNFVHRLNTDDPGNPVYNDVIDALFYSETFNQWSIANADFSDITENATYNIFIADDSSCIDHYTNTSNQNAFTTTIDDPNFNDSFPGPYAFVNHYLNPTFVLNNFNIGFFYNETLERRAILNEELLTIPLDSGFKILSASPASVSSRFTHISSTGNSTSNYTLIDNNFLNGNPDATFLFQHYFGVDGTSTEERIESSLGVFYHTPSNRWGIFTEDVSPIQPGVAFDIVVAPEESLSTNDLEAFNDITLSPNPAINEININTQSTVMGQVSIYTILGEKVLSFDVNATSVNIPIESLSNGVYLVKIDASDASKTMRFIKNQ